MPINKPVRHPLNRKLPCKTAKEIAQKKWKRRKARKVESSLKAEKIVPAEVARQEAILQAEAVAEKITREAGSTCQSDTGSS